MFKSKPHNSKKSMGNFSQGPWGTPCGINCWLYSCWLYSFYILEFLGLVRKRSPFFTLDFVRTVRNLTPIFYLQVEFFRIFGNFKSAQWNVFLGVQDTIDLEHSHLVLTITNSKLFCNGIYLVHHAVKLLLTCGN